jgi:PhnB protein
MFWGDRYGQVRDSNGHRWSFATHTTDLTPEELGARSELFMAAMASGGPPPAMSGGTPSATPIPAGYHTVTPILTIAGNDALDFYVTALGGEITERDLLPDGSLLHAEVRLGGSIVMFSGESPMEADVRTPAHLGAATLSVMHYVPDVDATYASATAAGATAAFPPTDMFWGDRYGVFVDASGQAWGVATHVRDVSDEEMAAAAASM